MGRCERVLHFMGREVQGKLNSGYKLSDGRSRSYKVIKLLSSFCREMSGREVTGR